MINSKNLFADKITTWIIDEAGFKQSHCQMSINYEYATYVSKLVVLSYFYYCVYWYTSKEIGKWFMNIPSNILYVNFV